MAKKSTEEKPEEPQESSMQLSTGISLDDFGGAEELAKALKDIEDAQSKNIDSSELQMSRISIAQPGTPEVADNEEGWRGGMLFDSVNRTVITYAVKAPWLLDKGIPASDVKTQDAVAIVPIFKLPTEYVKWPNKEEREAGQKNFHWKSLYLEEPRVREGLWKPKGTWTGEGAPPVTETINVLVMCLDTHGNPTTQLIVLSFSRTSFQTGRKFVTSCSHQKLDPNPLARPWWGRVYWLYTEGKKNDRNQTYYILRYAKGKPLVEFCQDKAIAKSIFTQCMKTSQELANSRELQEMYINSAQFSDDDSGSDYGADHAEANENESMSEEPSF